MTQWFNPLEDYIMQIEPFLTIPCVLSHVDELVLKYEKQALTMPGAMKKETVYEWLPTGTGKYTLTSTQTEVQDEQAIIGYIQKRMRGSGYPMSYREIQDTLNHITLVYTAAEYQNKPVVVIMQSRNIQESSKAA